MLRRAVAVMGAVVASMAVASASLAEDTGLDAIHEQYRVGGKVCFTEHTHYGNTAGAMATKAAAQKDAIESWRSFTDFEYGPRWSSFNKAIAKKMDCTQGGGGWTCAVEARPCR